MNQRTRSLYESATARARVLRHIDIVCLIVDGGGAMIVPMQDFVQAQKWASSRPASGNVLTDRGRFLDQIPALVSRPGSIVSTRGNPRQIEMLARAMRAAGYDLGEWTLPPQIRTPAPAAALGAKKPAAPGPADDA